MEALFSNKRQLLKTMATYVSKEAFHGERKMEEILNVLELIFRWGNEPVFVQQRILQLRLADADSEASTLNIDDVWAAWNTSFDFLALYNRREAIRETLLPIREALGEGLFAESKDLPRYQFAVPLQKQTEVAGLYPFGLECVSLDLEHASYGMLSGGAKQVSAWTWKPHFLTWMEKWMTHWDDVFVRLTRHQRCQDQYRSDRRKATPNNRRNEAVALRTHSQLFHIACQFTCHPSTIAHYLTSATEADIVDTVTGKVDPSRAPPAEREAVQGIQHMTYTRPVIAPQQHFSEWATVMHNWKSDQGWDGDDSAARLRKSCCEMVGGSLAVEPRFKQVLLNLLNGGQSTVMGLGKIRVQPSTSGVGYFQHGQNRVGYRTCLLDSKNFTAEKKEEIVKYVESGLMVWWIDVDDVDAMKAEVERRMSGEMHDSVSQAASSQAYSQATTQAYVTANAELNLLNEQRELRITQGRVTEFDTWFPSEETFEEFKKKIKARKVRVVMNMLRTAGADPGKPVKIGMLGFIPMDHWYTRPKDSPYDTIGDEWCTVRTEILEKAVELALDDVEETIWHGIVREVQEATLSECSTNLRELACRAGYSSYTTKGAAGDLDNMDAAQRRLFLDDEMFTQHDEADFILDHSDTTLPGRYRVAGVVYDDILKQHTMCFLDEYGNYLDSFELEHLVMREEDPLVREKRDAMQIKLRKSIFTHRPVAWAIGMTDATDLKVREMLRKFNVDWQAMLEDKDLRALLPPGFKPPKIEMVDSRIARVWARSRDAASELRDLDESRRKAVAVGRTLRSPLAALSSLFSADRDSLNLALTEMQDVVPRLTLLRRLEQQMVSIVSVSGLDINKVLRTMARSEHGLLQFLPGLGPRKAAHMLRTVAGHDAHIADRRDLLSEPFDMGECVYRNACSFVKVLLPAPAATQALDRFRLTLDRTTIHPMFYPVVNHLAIAIHEANDAIDIDALMDLDDEAYMVKCRSLAEGMMHDMFTARQQDGHISMLRTIDWDKFLTDWGAQYGGPAALMGPSEEEAAMVAGVPIHALMQLIRQQWSLPYALVKLEHSKESEDLGKMAEYRPYADESVFDRVVDDPTLLPDSLRVVTVSDTSMTGVRVRIAGCDAVRGMVSRIDTPPGLKYSEADWQTCRNKWFPKGKQFEARVKAVTKNLFLVRLSLLPDEIAAIKRKTDKSYRQMEKERKKKTAGEKGTIATQSQTMSQTKSQADTLSLDGTMSLTHDGTATSLLESRFEEEHQAAAQEDMGMAHVPEQDGGVLNSHALFAIDVETKDQVVAKFQAVDSSGRRLYKLGDCLMRIDLRSKSRSRFLLDIMMCDMPVYDRLNIKGAGRRTYEEIGFVTLKFELRGQHGGRRGVLVKERIASSADEREGGKPATKEVWFDDVDHFMFASRAYRKQIEQLRAHPKWSPKSYNEVKVDIVRQARKKNGTTPYALCMEQLTYQRDANTGEACIEPTKYNVMRFFVVCSTTPPDLLTPPPPHTLSSARTKQTIPRQVSAGVSEQEVSQGKIRKWLFEVCCQSSYRLHTPPP